MNDAAYQQCIRADCAATYAADEIHFACPRCHGLLDVCYDWSRCRVPESLAMFDERRAATGFGHHDRLDASGVWRFRELLPFAPEDQLVTIGEGRTLLQHAEALAPVVGLEDGRLYLQYEGFNPSGSFKDNGMAAAFTVARLRGRSRVACASTGNTSAALAMFAAHTRLPDGQPMTGVVFIGDDKIAFGKLSQALDYGALTLQVAGDFDVCMSLVKQASGDLGLYLMNSVNPYRLEGQKTIMYRVLEGLGWTVPDWIVVPGGNLGNTSAFGKAFHELHHLGLIDRVPRMAVINASGANTLYELYEHRGLRYRDGLVDGEQVSGFYRERQEAGYAARTVASAIEIGVPVNLEKALRSLHWLRGVVREVTDQEILDAKALVGRHGYGCEPASAASVAGLARLIREGVIGPDERVVCLLTGHGLKDPGATVDYHVASGIGGYSNQPVRVAPELSAIAAALEGADA